MKTWLCAIGGGKIERSLEGAETFRIDGTVLKKTNKKKPRLLFIPTASNDSESYCATFKDYFEGKHCCDVDFLFLLNNKITSEEIRTKILSSDMIYIGGGNTEFMLEQFDKKGLKPIILEAVKKGVVVCGISAGAILLFDRGISEKNGLLRIIKGWGLINGIFCPHSNKINVADVVKLVEDDDIVILSDDCSAILIDSQSNLVVLGEDEGKKLKIVRKKGKKLVATTSGVIKLI